MTEMEKKEITTGINKVWTEMKELLSKQEEEIKKYGETSVETKSALEKIEGRMDELETKQNTPPAAAALNIKEAKELKDNEMRKAFEGWVRKGEKGISPEHLKLMTVSDDTTGGYLCMPETLAGELIQDIVEYDPIRTVARIRQTSARSVKIRKKTGHITGGAWVGEVGSRTDLGNFTFGMIEVPVHEIAGYVDISNQDLADPDFNLEAELRLELSEQFGYTEGGAFLTGNGVNKPEGMLTTGINELGKAANGHASELQADGLIEIYYKLKSAYAANANWLLNRNTLKTVRKMKDGNGNYLWTPNLSIAKPPTILERPYVECPTMPDVAVNAYPIIFGDIRKLYTIIDRTIIETLRDPYTQAGTGTTRFYAYKRVGGQIVQKEAAYKLKVATTV